MTCRVYIPSHPCLAQAGVGHAAVGRWRRERRGLPGQAHAQQGAGEAPARLLNGATFLACHTPCSSDESLRSISTGLGPNPSLKEGQCLDPLWQSYHQHGEVRARHELDEGLMHAGGTPYRPP